MKSYERKTEAGIRFTKMHGAGNDYVYVDATESQPGDPHRLARDISDRHFGVGSDGLVLILPSETADFRMRMFNSDGSEAEMCGNASRCVGKYVYETGLTDKTDLLLETKGGIRRLTLQMKEGTVESVTVDMGVPILRPADIPVESHQGDIMLNEPYKTCGKEYRITGVSMGNPHAVIFTDRITDEQVLRHGPMLESAPIFPRKSNIEFARVIDGHNIEMRVWERGAGETLACGTGACATAVAAVLNGLTERTVDIHLRGGTLRVEWDEKSGHVLMSGPAEFICRGTYFPLPDNVERATSI